MTELLATLQAALGLAPASVRQTGQGALPSAFAVTDLACASIAVAGQALAELLYSQTGHRPQVSVDRRLASFWFAGSIRPQGWSLPSPWDPIAGDYPSRDGWIRLHTNAPHHRAAAERVLGAVSGRDAMAARVASWDALELEQAIVDQGGCAAQMRSWAQWQAHPQGQAVNAEPLVHWLPHRGSRPNTWSGSSARPLAGLKVLDLTRVLAGPVASRLLAGLGAEVLRIDPPGWNEPALEPEVTLGKRCARLDLHDLEQRAVFEGLLAEADLLLHGYRADALDHLGYDAETRQRIAPGLIEVSLNAYGWSGPWRDRRGFDSLVQMSAGIAAAGMDWKAAEQPLPLPVQALDHATGYLMAASALRALNLSLSGGQGTSARLSLARTAKLLVEHCRSTGNQTPLRAETPEDQGLLQEQTPWGPARRLQVPLHISATPVQWDCPATVLGAHRPKWW
ncbi:acyl-CoA transferase [Pseudomonas protegens]|uniref:Acyl-CoA transferase n=1 Tax=Pseudomonas protegens TaxID=380021 RepID=A0A2T6GJ30_9PSED|nr:CoA transferase [Pseudomonas protegens]PUA44161.1 acyl-CoA transferase [Pseudomonas protegens]